MGMTFFSTLLSGLLATGGLIGPGEPTHAKPGAPPMKPASWHKLEGDVMGLDEAWGYRIKPRGVFEIPGGVGVLYNSRPPDPAEAREQGIAQDQTGSLAFSRNLVDWHDYPGNPVLREVQDWQGSFRAMPRAMLYDEPNEQWVVYFGDSLGDYPGIRAVGTAFSRNLRDWHYAEGPTVTVMDYAAAVPERIEATEDELKAEGRVYAEWAVYLEGQYYLRISGTNRTGEDRRYGNLLLVSDAPDGPFREHADFQGDFMPPTRPAYWNGRWYAVFPGMWDGEHGFGLASSEALTGPYELNPHNPIFTVETTTRARPQLFRYGGVWAVLYCHQHNVRDMPLRLALSHIHPDLIP